MGVSIIYVRCQDRPKQVPPHEIQAKQLKQSNQSYHMPQGKVEAKFVCFPNNRYMGKEQFSFVIENKKYYGCCMGCIGKLKTDPSHRFAIDPFSNKKVDKAEAFIVIKPGSKTGEVLYFESESNYNGFIEAIN